MRSHSSGLPQRIQTSLKSNDYVNVFTGQHTSTERISLTKECGWKDGDRGGLAEWEQTHGKEKSEVCLDINRPSHGKSFAATGEVQMDSWAGYPSASRFRGSASKMTCLHSLKNSAPKDL